MNNENLSREEAAERSALISVDTYDVHVDLTNAKDPEFESPTLPSPPSDSPANTPAQKLSSTTSTTASTPLSSTAPNYLADVVDGARITLPNLQAENVLTITVVSTTPAPAKVCTATSTLRRSRLPVHPVTSPPTAAESS